jgi:hypothetical protein
MSMPSYRLALAAVVGSMVSVAVANGPVQMVFASELHVPAGSPKSAVPGISGLTFSNFPRAFRSPTSGRWVVAASVLGSGGTATDQVWISGQGLSGTTVLQEGVTTSDAGGTFTIGTQVNPRITNDGTIISSMNSGGLIVRQLPGGRPEEVLNNLSTVPGTSDGLFVGSTPFSGVNLTSGGIAFQAQTTTTAAGNDESIFIGTWSPFGQPTSVPTGQLLDAGESNFPMKDLDAGTLATDGLGNNWIVLGEINHPMVSRERVAVVNGAVVVQTGQSYPGTGVVTSINDVWMEANGDWFVRGVGSTTARFVMRNGQLIAAVGQPITASSSATWTAIADYRGDNRGNYAILGTISGAATTSDEAIVVNGRYIVAREGDAIDVDADGTLETNTFLHTFQNRLMVNTDGYIYFATRLKDTAIAAADKGGINRSSLLRVALCGADFGSEGGSPSADGLLDNNDFIVFIDQFFQQTLRADIGSQGGADGSDGQWDNNDFVVFIDRFFSGC